MLKFERYIIYPLLIVALFYSMTGGQIGIITEAEKTIDKLIVKEISVVNERGSEIVNISSNDYKAGSLTMYGKNGNKEAIYIESQDPGLETYVSGRILISKNGAPDIAMFSGGKGGNINIFNNGRIRSYNKNDDIVWQLGTTQEGEHGGIWVFDRYGENPAFYGHDRY